MYDTVQLICYLYKPLLHALSTLNIQKFPCKSEPIVDTGSSRTQKFSWRFLSEYGPNMCNRWMDMLMVDVKIGSDTSQVNLLTLRGRLILM